MARSYPLLHWGRPHHGGKLLIQLEYGSLLQKYRPFLFFLVYLWSNPSEEKDDAQDTVWIHIMHILNLPFTQARPVGFMKEPELELAV